MTKKRGNGEGTISKRGDGRWQGQITTGYDPKTGKAKRKTVYAKNRREVVEKLDELKKQSRIDGYVQDSKTTVGELVKQFLVEKKKKIRATTWRSYESVARVHIVPQLGLIPLQKLTSGNIRQFYKYMDSLDKPRTSQIAHVLIKSALSFSIQQHLIPRNPVEYVDPPRYSRPKITPMTAEQVQCFLCATQNDRWHPAFVIAMGTGMRLGEIAALTWSKVNITTGWIEVTQRVSSVKAEETSTGRKTRYDFDGPKSEAGFRKIPIPGNVLDILKRHKASQSQEKLLCGSAYNDQGFVLSWPDGRMVDPGYLSKHFHKLALKYVGDYHFHSMRHTYATLLLEKNEHPNVVKELLGDSQISVVLDTYSHVFPEIKQKAASAINDVFSIKRNETPQKEG